MILGCVLRIYQYVFIAGLKELSRDLPQPNRVDEVEWKYGCRLNRGGR